MEVVQWGASAREVHYKIIGECSFLELQKESRASASKLDHNGKEATTEIPEAVMAFVPATVGKPCSSMDTISLRLRWS